MKKLKIPQAWSRQGLVIPKANLDTSSNVSGDPCIVWDPEIEGWRMIYFGHPPGHAQAVNRNLDMSSPGAWELQGPLPVANPRVVGPFHKPFFILDPHQPNQAALVEGRYGLLVVSFRHTQKIIHRAWSEKLSGPWQFEDQPLILPGEGSDFDARHVDAITGYYFPERGEFLYFYMGYPTQAQPRSLSPFGSAQGVAVQKLHETQVIKLGQILAPTQTPGHWASGWIGGLQLLPGENHRWIAIVNASPTAPDPTIGEIWTEEPPPSLGGFAWCDEEWPVQGWHFAPEPLEWIEDLDHDARTQGEGVNLWRHFIHLSPDGTPLVYYNSGSYGQEQIFLKTGVSERPVTAVHRDSCCLT